MKSSISRWALIILLVSILPIAACQGFGSSAVMEEEQPPEIGQYLEFKDVQIPAGLKLDNKSSFVYESNNVRAGVLGLTGKLPLVDVLDFFETNMPRDGWSLLSSFKYQKNILMYTKADKVCLVIASYPYGDEALRMEVWVSPIKPGQQVPGVGSPSLLPYSGTTGAPMIKPAGPKEETLTEETS